MGTKTSLDDFGTGYSSLSYLANFPIDQIKIDKSFIQNLDNPSTEVVVRAIINLAANLSLRVVAEGVETIDQLEWLRNANCDDIQGFLLACPSPAEKILAISERRLLPAT